MEHRRLFSLIKEGLSIITCASVVLAVGCSSDSTMQPNESDQLHMHVEQQTETISRGPHGGRLLSDGTFSVELQIFETGVEPQYRIYAFNNDAPVAPELIAATVELVRLGNLTETFVFHPVSDFLTSDSIVAEPHSFSVTLHAEYQHQKHSWNFDSFEGRTEIAGDVALTSGLRTEKATSRDIATIVKARGKIVPSEHRVSHVIPRFSGVVKEGRKHIGDRVEKGEVLAIIESNQSLQPFEVKSQTSGTVIFGHLVVGEFVPENQMVFLVADIDEVWADLLVPLNQYESLKIGQKVRIATVSSNKIYDGSISYITPYADERTQAGLVRVVIANENHDFLPGMFVTASITIKEQQIAVGIKKSGLQTFRDWEVTFLKVGDIYEIRPLTLGQSDDVWVEVLAGLAPGDEYVTENSFLIKADILKSGASHDH